MRTALIQYTSAAILIGTTNVFVHADCNCRGGGTTPNVAAETTIPMLVSSRVEFGMFAPAVHAPHPLQADGRRYPFGSTSGWTKFGESAALQRSLVPIVPGTVGRTYSRTSHPIPTDKHPRIAMVAVRDHGRVENLSVHGMNGFRMSNGIWLFETDRPLLPGKESIVRVEARGDPHDIQPHDFKFVRLLPGRLVYLDF